MREQTSFTTGRRLVVDDLVAGAARCAESGERQRRLDPDVVAALLTAGFARHFVPAAHGGHAGTFVELTSAVTVVGESCAATAWCASLLANLGRMAGLLPSNGKAEVWADGPDAAVVGSLTPFGQAEPVAGGWRVSGRWPYISAVDFSDWALVCARVPGGDAAQAKMFAVPRAQYRITDTWFNVGMAATGSNTLTVEDVVVPEARSFDRAALFQGRPADSDDPCHHVPLQAANGLSFVTPVLGAARGAQRAWTAYVAEKVRSAATRPGSPPVARGPYDVTLAQSAAEIDAAEFLLHRAAAIADQGSAVTPLEATQNLRDSAVSVRMLQTAVNRLFSTAGTSGHATTSSVQRAWRDVNTAASHVALQLEPAAGAYADHVFKI